MCEKEDLRKKDYFLLLVFIVIACLLRTVLLGNTFQSADNAALADRIVHHRGYAWMIREYYGFLINFIVKIFAASISSFGLKLTEFWWKLPVALLGSAQVWLTFFFLRHLFQSKSLALWGAAFIAILPIHVMQSRYLWGYEVFGIFFLTLFIWSWINFLEKPSFKTGRQASVTLAFYLISHGYILPLFPALIVSWLIFSPERKVSGKETEVFDQKKIQEDQEARELIRLFKETIRGPFKFFKIKSNIIFRRLRINSLNFWRYRLWLYPLLFSPLTIGSIRHTFQKSAKTGFYYGYMKDFIANTGIFLFFFFAIALILFGLNKFLRHRYLWFIIILAGSYLAPLFLATPPGVTVVRGYMSIGIYWLLLFSLTIWDKVINGSQEVLEVISQKLELQRNGIDEEIGGQKESYEKIKENEGEIKLESKQKTMAKRIKKRAAFALILFLFLFTLWGTVESLFFRDSLFDFTMVKAGRGDIFPDPGTKAAGYLLFKYLPVEKYPASSWPILVLHRNIEPPCVSYYWRREAMAFYDYSFEQTKAAFKKYKDKVAFIVADPEQVSFICEDPRFDLRIVLYFHGQPRLFIFSRNQNILPLIRADVKEFNRAFDRELSPRVSFD